MLRGGQRFAALVQRQRQTVEQILFQAHRCKRQNFISHSCRSIYRNTIHFAHGRSCRHQGASSVCHLRLPLLPLAIALPSFACSRMTRCSSCLPPPLSSSLALSHQHIRNQNARRLPPHPPRRCCPVHGKFLTKPWLQLQLSRNQPRFFFLNMRSNACDRFCAASRPFVHIRQLQPTPCLHLPL